MDLEKTACVEQSGHVVGLFNKFSSTGYQGLILCFGFLNFLIV